MRLLLRNALLWPDGAPASVLVESGRIAALREGPADDALDLGGALLLPGFVDTHTHLGWAGEELWRVRWNASRTDAPAPRTRPEALAAVRATRARLEPGFWLTGGGWSRETLRDDELPTLAELDEASDGAPAFLVSEDGSLGLVNSIAMRLMRLAELRDPPGGRIDRATGRLYDGATRAMLTREVVPEVDRHRRRGELRAALRELPRLGITEAHDIATYPGEPEPPLIRWERSWTDATLFDELELPVRVTVRPSLHRRREFVGRKIPRLQGLKQFAGPTYRNPGPEVMTEWVREAHAAGLAVSVHALDDDACAATIDVFEAAGAHPGGPRHRLVHARALKRGDVERIARLGLVVEAQPWDTVAEPIASADPDAVALPLRSLLDAGARVCLGSDWRDDNVVPLDPLAEIRAAVERDDEAITVAEAVDCYTRGGALAGGSEKRRGRIEVGCDADLVALRADPDAILDGEVALTVCAGAVTYAGCRSR